MDNMVWFDAASLQQNSLLPGAAKEPGTRP